MPGTRAAAAVRRSVLTASEGYSTVLAMSARIAMSSSPPSSPIETPAWLPEGHRPGGPANPVKHRPDRDLPLSDLARQGGQRGFHSSGPSDIWQSHVSGPQFASFWRGGLPDQFDHARALPGLAADGLFIGQMQGFFDEVGQLATARD